MVTPSCHWQNWPQGFCLPSLSRLLASVLSRMPFMLCRPGAWDAAHVLSSTMQTKSRRDQRIDKRKKMGKTAKQTNRASPIRHSHFFCMLLPSYLNSKNTKATPKHLWPGTLWDSFARLITQDLGDKPPEDQLELSHLAQLGGFGGWAMGGNRWCTICTPQDAGKLFGLGIF